MIAQNRQLVLVQDLQALTASRRGQAESAGK
jgi:hypothetical protein